MNSSAESREASLSPVTVDIGTQVVPRAGIDWYRSAPWWRLLSQSVGISWRASHLLVAAIAVWVTLLGWYLSWILFAPTGMASIPFSLEPNMRTWLEASWDFINFDATSKEAYQPITLRSLAYWIFGLLWTIGVWAFAGGLLTRRSLMEMGVRTSVGWGPSCQLVCQRWLSMVWAICMPLVAIAALAVIPFILGVMARFGVVGQSIALLLMIPTILLIIGIGWSAAISALGFPLSICAIAAEKNADAFDGVSRSAAYLFQRPITIVLFLGFAVALGTIGEVLVAYVFSVGEKVLWSAFAMGSGSNIQESLGDGSSFRKSLLWISRTIVMSLQSAFLFSFFWSVAAAAYLTLRWEVDHTDFDDLDLREIGEPVAMPRFEPDSRGVAEAVAEP